MENNKKQYTIRKTYAITQTSDGLEVCFDDDFNEPIYILPPLTTLLILGNKYNYPLDFVQDGVTGIFLGNKFNYPIENMPSGLKFIALGADFSHSIDCLPDSVEDIRVSQFYNCKINKLPKALKSFNVIQIDNIYDDEIIEGELYLVQRTYDKDKYYDYYMDLESKYPNVKFFY